MTDAPCDPRDDCYSSGPQALRTNARATPARVPSQVSMNVPPLAAASRVGLCIFAAALLLLSNGSAAQSVHRCVVDGRTVFQQAPCAGSGPTMGQDMAAREQAAREAQRAREAQAGQAAGAARVQTEADRPARAETDRIAGEIRAAIAAEAARDRANPASPTRVCRASVAAILGLPLDAVVLDTEKDGVITVAHTRKGDGRLVRNKCRIAGSSVTWGSEPGRWRDHQLDEKVSFRTEGATLVIQQRFPDGSTLDKRF